MLRSKHMPRNGTKHAQNHDNHELKSQRLPIHQRGKHGIQTFVV
jgi:hypothetical protein